jgi:predicted dehydrogenase
MSRRLSIGVIGLRFGSQVHVPAFRADARCEVVALAGRDESKAADAARALDIPAAYGDWRQLVTRPEIDAVSIAVPPAEQPSIILEAARQRKHVFCEKPLAASVADACAALSAVEAAGVAHAIDFIFPEIPAWQQAKDALAGGAIGQPVHFAYSWRTETYASRTNARTWKNEPEQGGGVLGNFVSHVLYNLEWLFGGIQEFEAAACGRDRRTGRAFDAVVRMESGVSGSVSICTDAFPGGGHRIEIYGDQGALVLQNSTSDYVSGFELHLGTRETDRLEPLTSGDGAGISGDGRLIAVGRLVRRFVDAIDQGGPMAPNLADGVRVQRLLALADAATQPFRPLAGTSTQPIP